MKNPTGFACEELQQVSDEVEFTAEDKDELQRLGRFSLFDSCSLPNQKGGLAFVGGPVGALEFHPQVKGICVLSGHRNDQRTHEILKCYSGIGHIQFWDFSGVEGSFLGTIPHYGNCVWDLKWRPEEPTRNDAGCWRGLLAASLGDGTVMICYIDYSSDPNGFPPSSEEFVTKTVILRDERRIEDRVPVRAIQWSSDGSLLVVGAADGSLEVYNTAMDNNWQKWSIPAHESVVMDLRWVSENLLCSLGLSCVLRLRDIRDPVSTLEQNAEGLSGSLSMDTLEPNVAVVGGDYGYLRVVRLRAGDGATVKLPVKRVNLQTGGFRDMKSIPINGPGGEPTKTLLYTGGAEGVLHECTFPRPIWTPPELCNIASTKIAQKLRWSAKEGCGLDGETEPRRQMLQLHLGEEKGGERAEMKDQSQTAVTVVSVGQDERETASVGEGAVGKERLEAETTPSKEGVGSGKKAFRKSRAVGRPADAKEYTWFGERYSQKAVITRVSLSKTSDLLAVANDGGFVVWMGLEQERHERIARQDEESREVERGRPRLVKPPRKRGRPRKYPLSTGDVESGSVENGRAGEGKKEDGEEKKKRGRGRPRLGLPVFGPKRKRGRPKKQTVVTEDAGGLEPVGKKARVNGEKDGEFEGKEGVGSEVCNVNTDDCLDLIASQPGPSRRGDLTQAAVPVPVPVRASASASGANVAGASAGDGALDKAGKRVKVETVELGVGEEAKIGEGAVEVGERKGKMEVGMDGGVRRSGRKRGRVEGMYTEQGEGLELGSPRSPVGPPRKKMFVRVRLREAKVEMKVPLKVPLRLRIREEDGEEGRTRRRRKPSWKVVEG